MKNNFQIKQRISFKDKDAPEFKDFLKKYSKNTVYDLYETLYKARLAVNNSAIYFLPPDKKDETLQQQYDQHVQAEKAENFQLGDWITTDTDVFHLIQPEDFLELRTVRNRNLITWEEQKSLYKKKIVLVGLSVGSNVLLNLVRMGVGNSYSIFDFDTIEAHNLNRTPYSLRDVGQTKLQSTAKIINGIDPYIDLNLINSEVVDLEDHLDFAKQDIIIDAFDHFEGKIELRKKAKKYKKPVVSGWDVGDGMVIIVERYDEEANLGLDIFLNNVPIEEVLKPVASLREKIDIFIKIIGKETHDERMLQSVYSIGNELTGIPQTIIATSLTSAVFTKVVCDVLLNKSTKSFRNHLDLNTLIY